MSHLRPKELGTARAGELPARAAHFPDLLRFGNHRDKLAGCTPTEQ